MSRVRKIFSVGVAFFLFQALWAPAPALAEIPGGPGESIHGHRRESWSLPRRSGAKNNGRPNQDVLTQELAQRRRAQIESVRYELEYRFRKGAEDYSGAVNIFVKLRDKSQALSIDALLTHVDSVKVNGKAISNFVMRTGSFDIPASELKDEIKIEVAFRNKFSEYGQGLMHFTDPQDGREYIYSDSEPYGAHTAFPCFDQPDLKATYRVSLHLPEGWRGISNEPADREFADASGWVEFPESKVFSTYLLFVGAGEYDVWRDSFNGMPLAIYARQSLRSYVDAAKIFATTKAGLAFFPSFFGHAYPFPKYDHIFTPELGPGAMENPGAVTMNERMIHRGQPSRGELVGRDNTILHEMAHHWFGDLVTMKWWEDLWLNESFATYMASIALDRGMGLGQDAWLDFAGTKSWARWQDLLPTTHPIVGSVADTDVSATIFDGITYGKGASVLQQMHRVVGEQAFQQGVANYFRDNAWSNATRIDFVGSVAQAAGRDLTAWSRGWLESSGLNKVHSEWSCVNDAIQDFALVQERTSSGLYLPHDTSIALFRRAANGRLVLDRVLPSHYEGERTELMAMRGMPCPDLVFANYLDQDFGNFRLDLASMATVNAGLSQLEDPLLRIQIAGVLQQMVLEGDLRTSDYLNLLVDALVSESNDLVLSSWIGRHSSAKEMYWGPLTNADRDILSVKLEATAWDRLQTSRKAMAPERQLWTDFFVEIARSPLGVQRLRELLNDTNLEQARRWRVLVRLSALGESGADQMVAAELVRDKSEEGVRFAYAASVAAPNLASKTKAWEELTDPNSTMRFGQRRLASQYFHNADHPELVKPFVAPFFQLVNTIDWAGETYMVRDFFSNLFPAAACDQETLDASEAAMAAIPTLPYAARRAWTEANFGLRQCIEMRTANGRR